MIGYLISGLVGYCIGAKKPLLSAHFSPAEGHERAEGFVLNDPLKGHSLAEFKQELHRFLREYEQKGQAANPGWLQSDIVDNAIVEYKKEFGGRSDREHQ